ncbi:MAG TPA: GIY-YIG nuclease family protein [Rhizobiaceae bacterium]|mgnify:CR=1 FL=1|nr:GIY-YIG nuclease family protein [Rhizobiaceae bacterium]
MSPPNKLKRRKKPALSIETKSLRSGLHAALRTIYPGTNRTVGSYSCGVYAFFDYDGEPIYVGQTFEGLSSRVGRHLTNQRTDAVAMSVLDPFEVHSIELFPLCEFDGVGKKHPEFSKAKSALNALEAHVFWRCVKQSRFGAVLNEKEPGASPTNLAIPDPVRMTIVSSEVHAIRGHPDVRIARRAQTIARLAQVISEREVNIGLRKTLVTQARRLESLAVKQFEAWGGEAAVPKKRPGESEDSEVGEET